MDPKLERWLFGEREYANPILRWAAMPMLRAAMVLVVLNIVVGGGFIPLWIVNAAVLAISLLAMTVNAVLMQRSRSPQSP
jgi:uncharacterized membrane protein YbaN (DUF454 family)